MSDFKVGDIVTYCYQRSGGLRKTYHLKAEVLKIGKVQVKIRLLEDASVIKNFALRNNEMYANADNLIKQPKNFAIVCSDIKENYEA